MEEAIAGIVAAKFFWNESKAIRNWLWSKLPFAQDQKKREMADQMLAEVLEDSNKLVRSLVPHEADAAIDRRIEQFRQDLVKAKIPADQADTLVDRGALFVKLLVTGPMGETAILRERVGELESRFTGVERETSESKALSEAIHRMELRVAGMAHQVTIAWLVAAGAVILALACVAIVVARTGR